MSESSVEQDLGELIVAFQDAAFDDEGWMPALGRLASLTGSVAGQLIGFNSQGVVFNWLSETDPAVLAENEAAGGNDPAVNSRLRIGGSAPLLSVLDENAFETAQDILRFPAYGAHLEKWDAPYVCLANLTRSPTLSVGMSVNRNSGQGGMSDEQKRLFTTVVPHVRAAVQMRQRLNQEAACFAAGALSEMGVAAFVCNLEAEVLAMTPSAEALAARGEHLSLSQGQLRLKTAQSDRFRSALARDGRAFRDSGLPETLLLDDGSGVRLLAEIYRISNRDHILAPGASALVVIRGSTLRGASQVVETAQSLFGFTRAEASVAQHTLAGLTPSEIAATTGVGLGTVRSQIRSLYNKSGASNQLSFVALLHSLR